MPASALHACCQGLLAEYVSDPWIWPRESDLVVDVVDRIRRYLTTRRVPAILKGPGFQRRLVDITPQTQRLLPRVRTEVKVLSRTQKGRRAGAGQDHDERVDVAVLRDQVVSVFIHENGVRDVLLATPEGDLEALLEVKVYPDLYLYKGRCPWLEDVRKLSGLAPLATRGVLFLDTSLPLETVGVTYQKKRGEDRLGRAGGSLPPWPLEAKTFQVATTDEQGKRCALTFTPTSQPEVGGLHLWSLGLSIGHGWRPGFDTKGHAQLVTLSSVTPVTWKIVVNRRDRS